MIGRLSGKLLGISPDRILLDVAGVGYDVQIPLSTFYGLPGANGSEVSLHIHTHVREDALQLFGFGSGEERSTFEQLIAISGVGPRMALAILSGIGVDELRRTVVRQDRARLQKIPGVGKKTAERLLLELRDKMKIDVAPADDGGSVAPLSGGLQTDAHSALVNLGYADQVADRAVRTAIKDAGADAGLESVLKRALSSLVR